MGNERLDLLALARSIDHGSPIDWTKVQSDAVGEGEIALMRDLRLVSKIVEAHRSQQALIGDPQIAARTTGQVDTLVGANAPRGPAQPLPLWGHLEILEKVGEGGYGEVFRSRDTQLVREVALKLLRKETPVRDKLPAALIEEGRLLARVRHPNVATVYGAEQHEGRVGLWMEFIHGRTLADLVRSQGVFGAPEAGLIGLDLCRALAAVHRAGLIHRDVKAQNVMRESGGRIVLMDFSAGRDLRRAIDDQDRLITGTPLYMAPEVVRGEPATVQADIYGLGVLLFYLVTGSYPIQATTMRELRAAHDQKASRPLGELRPDLPPAFIRVVERALAPESRDRFAGAASMEQALAAALGLEGRAADARLEPDEGESPRGRWRWVVPALAAGLVLAMLGGGWFALKHAPDTTAVQTMSEPSPATVVASSGTETSIVENSYTVEASFYRGIHARERLAPGDRVRVGDALSLELKASRDLYVYVVNEDDKGEAVLLFPQPGREATNPLAPGVTHLLPGPRAGEQEYWQVTSPGGREHFLVVASPERLAEFEEETVGLTRPEFDHALQYAQLSEQAKSHLRGLTGLVTGPAPQQGTARGRLFDRAEILAARPEVVRGAWIRRLDLENPAP